MLVSQTMKYIMNRMLFVLLSVSLLLTGCADESLRNASESYKKNRDYVSLEKIVKHLDKSMKREKVEELLGKPDYSPTEGQYYYSSDRREVPEGAEHGEINIPVGLIVEYRDEKDNSTNELQDFRLGAIGE